MDRILPASLHGDEIERRLMERAIDEARASRAPARPHSEVRLEMLQMVEELEAKILSDTGSLDAGEAELFYKEAAVAKARRNKGPGVPNDVACADMEKMIHELEQKISMLTAT